MYWPELDVSRGILPRRAFLVAKHAIPAMVELTWDYGRHYERHWLGDSSGVHAHGRIAGIGGGGGAAEGGGLSCAEGGVRGGISSGLLGEEAATAEARDQPLAACTSLSLPRSP